jgi:hypothetical protein
MIKLSAKPPAATNTIIGTSLPPMITVFIKYPKTHCTNTGENTPTKIAVNLQIKKLFKSRSEFFDFQ